MAVFQKSITLALEYAYRDLEKIASQITTNKEHFAMFVADLRKDKELTIYAKIKRVNDEYDAFSKRHEALRAEYTRVVEEKYSILRDLAIGVRVGPAGEIDRAALARVMAAKDRQQILELVSTARATNDSVLIKALAAGAFIKDDWDLYHSMADDLAKQNDPNAAALLEFELGFGRLATNQRKMEMNMWISMPARPTINE